MVNSLLEEEIQYCADQHNQDSHLLDICSGSQVWLFLDRVKEGYAGKLAHMWHGPFRVIDKCGDHAVRLIIAGTPYKVFPVVHVSKLRLVRLFPYRPRERLRVNKADRVDFDEALLPEDSWIRDLVEDEFKMERITDMQLGRRTRYGRAHRHF